MAHRNQVRGLFCRHDTRNLSYREDVAFGDCFAADGVEDFLRDLYVSGRGRGSFRLRLAGNIDHKSIPVLVKMRKPVIHPSPPDI